MDNYMDRLVEKINLQNNSRSSYRDREEMPIREQQFDSDYRRSSDTDYRRPSEIDFRRPLDAEYRRSPEPPGGGYRREEVPQSYQRQEMMSGYGQQDSIMNMRHQAEDLEKLGSALVQAQAAGFDETNGLIRNNANQILGAIDRLGDQLSKEQLSKNQPVEHEIAVVSEEEKLTRQIIEEINASGREELAGTIGDNVHKEDVKLYRNIQAVVQDESAKTMERLKVLDQLQAINRLEKLNELDIMRASLDKKISGVKTMMLWVLIILVLNLGGIGVMIASLVLGLF